ncbi:MAG: hypothetical protein JW860_16285 [Sedimentisphaerales bacterium]|nr:hypothetical protein [Sedimentisphaerales bacterium]
MRKLYLVVFMFALMVSASSVAWGHWYEDDDFKWLQYPDLSDIGIDVNMSYNYMLADDFLCTVTGPITDFHLWTSWYYDYLPFGGDPSMVDFLIQIYDDIPADPCTGEHSRPGTILREWYFGAYDFDVRIEQDQILEGWMEPPDWYEFPGDTICWQYNFYLDPCEVFIQEGSPDESIVYWLAVQAYPHDTMAYFGLEDITGPLE